jgi:hypothetical protein
MLPILIREKIKISKIRDFIFESISFDIIKLKEEVTTVIMDAHIIYVEIRNITNKPVIINRKKYLTIIEKYETERCYLVKKKLKNLIIERISWARKTLIMDISTLTAANLITTSSNPATTMTEMNMLKKVITDFGIIIYGDITTRQRSK